MTMTIEFMMQEKSRQGCRHSITFLVVVLLVVDLLVVVFLAVCAFLAGALFFAAGLVVAFLAGPLFFATGFVLAFFSALCNFHRSAMVASSALDASISTFASTEAMVGEDLTLDRFVNAASDFCMSAIVFIRIAFSGSSAHSTGWVAGATVAPLKLLLTGTMPSILDLKCSYTSFCSFVGDTEVLRMCTNGVPW